jgi:23S rRNA (uracil1939-C5)-methyltransferase
MKIDFNIEHIDPLGQGVSKKDGCVTFIKKTLPGEIGDASLLSAKKGVQFAVLKEITTKSPERITPECPHFQLCNGCDFLHTSYQNEKKFKLNTIERQLNKFAVKKINYHEATERTGYRNRLQLHYNLDSKLLGFQSSAFEIIEVPHCLIGMPDIKTELTKLYRDQYWISLLAGQPTKGHIEIYYKDKTVQTTVNSSYADGGFTQVNREMNLQLKEFITATLSNSLKDSDTLIDLFGGNGNLTNQISQKSTVVDYYTQVPAPTSAQAFLSLDLYSKTALASLKKFCRNANWLIIDPPRSGLKNLTEFVLAYAPQGFIYVSCQSTSFTRDTLPILSLYQLNEVHLFDLFPGTHHFETVGIFTRRKLPL